MSRNTSRNRESTRKAALDSPRGDGFSLRSWWPALALVAAVMLLYVPSYSSAFIWDDDAMVYDQPLIKRADGLARFWFSNDAPDYFPLTSTLLWVQWRLWGTNPAGYHVVNALLHAMACVLLWRVLLRLQVRGAGFAALLYAVHPVCVETVAWITETKNTLPMVLCLASLLAYLRAESKSGGGTYVLALCLFALALLAKTSVVMLPFTLLIIAWWQHGALRREDLIRAAPFFALSLLLGLITMHFQSTRAIIHTEIRTDSLVSRVAVAGAAAWFYLHQALMPVHLCFVYPRWNIPATNIVWWLPTICMLGLVAALWFLRKRITRGPVAALLIFLVNLLPILGFANIYFMRYSLVADHWQYVALPSLLALFAAIFYKFGARVSEAPSGAKLSTVATGAAAVIVLLLAGRMVAHQQNFGNNESLFQHVLRCNPDAWIAHNNLGTMRLQERRFDEALQHLIKARELNPKLFDAHLNIGNVYAAKGDFQRALESYKTAAGYRADHRVHAAMGDAYAAIGDFATAQDQYHTAIRLRPDYAPVHAARGRLLMKLQNYSMATQSLGEAVKYRTNDPELRNLWCEALYRAGEKQRALEELQRTVEQFPAYAPARQNLESLSAKQ